MSGGVYKPANATTYRKACIALAEQEQPRIVVEVGVYEGALSRMFAALPSLERLFIIDSWDGSYCDFGQAHMDKIAASVLAWGAGVTDRATIHRVDSAVGAAMFADESVDFFHTDGDHSLDGIRADITNWLPKVKVGGIMSGDNYEASTVAQGVDELLPHRQLGANGRFWWARK